MEQIKYNYSEINIVCGQVNPLIFRLGETLFERLRGREKIIIITMLWVVMLGGWPSRAESDEARYHSVQIGSFTLRQLAVKNYETLRSNLEPEQTRFLRVEQCGAFFALRIGKFTDRDSALPLLGMVREYFPEALVIETRIKPERYVLPALTPTEEDGSPAVASVAKQPSSTGIQASAETDPDPVGTDSPETGSAEQRAITLVKASEPGSETIEEAVSGEKEKKASAGKTEPEISASPATGVKSKGKPLEKAVVEGADVPAPEDAASGGKPVDSERKTAGARRLAALSPTRYSAVSDRKPRSGVAEAGMTSWMDESPGAVATSSGSGEPNGNSIDKPDSSESSASPWSVLSGILSWTLSASAKYVVAFFLLVGLLTIFKKRKSSRKKKADQSGDAPSGPEEPASLSPEDDDELLLEPELISEEPDKGEQPKQPEQIQVREVKTAPAGDDGRLGLIPGFEQRLFRNSRELSQVEGNILGVQKGVRTFYVTSCFNGEGKTTSAIQMAYALASNSTEKVLLIDGNLKAPKVHELFGAGPSPGLTELLTSACKPREALRKTRYKNLSIMTVGSNDPDSSNLLRERSLEPLLKALQDFYRYIVFDGQSVYGTSDMTIVANQFDGVFIVVESERTKWDAVQTAMEKIRNVDGRVLGAILNKRKYYIPKLLYGKI